MTKIEAKQAVSPVDLLKAAVTGSADPKPADEVLAERGSAEGVVREGKAAKAAFAVKGITLPPLPRIDWSRHAVPGAALAIGALLGGGVMAITRSAAPSNDAVLALSTTLDAGRVETARLSGDIAQLHRVLADLRASTDTARKEAGTRSGALADRLAQLDKTLNAKTAALGERFEQVEREQNARIAGLAAQLDRRASAAATPTTRAEPTQTGSLADTPRAVEAKIAETRAAETRSSDIKSPEAKPSDAKLSDAKPSDAKTSEAKLPETKLASVKPVDLKAKPVAAEKTPVIDGWALRDIFEGAAILENRRHHLVEVGPGDIVPGLGRVEAVERRGRDWVVVTRQGLITPQTW